MIKKNINIGIIGCGNMGEAILERMIGERDFSFFICERRPKVITKIKKKFFIYKKRIKFLGISGLVSVSDVIIIAVKPQDIEIVLNQMRQSMELFKRSPLVISIAAGIRINYLEKMLGKDTRIIRLMPNIGIKIGEAVIALKYNHTCKPYDLKIANKIFAGLGKIFEIKKESLMDAMTAISGSGPAYVAYIVEAILKVANSLGISTVLARQLILQTFIGTLKLLEKNNFNTQELILKVASKKGTTQKALDVFKNYKLDWIIQKAILSAFKRAGELSHK
jgi:pyrroline-5-carboxylate reductase